MRNVESRLEIAIQQLRKLIHEERQAGPAPTGSLKGLYRKCGGPNCPCASGRQDDLHGPYWQYSYYVGGKLAREMVSKDVEPKLRAATERCRKIEEYEKALSVLERLLVLGHPFESIKRRWGGDWPLVQRVLRQVNQVSAR